MGHPGLFLHLFLIVLTKQFHFYILNVKNIHPESGAGIRTHDLSIMSLLLL